MSEAQFAFLDCHVCIADADLVSLRQFRIESFLGHNGAKIFQSYAEVL
jgi:hypothetical protein